MLLIKRLIFQSITRFFFRSNKFEILHLPIDIIRHKSNELSLKSVLKILAHYRLLKTNIGTVSYWFRSANVKVNSDLRHYCYFCLILFAKCSLLYLRTSKVYIIKHYPGPFFVVLNFQFINETIMKTDCF